MDVNVAIYGKRSKSTKKSGIKNFLTSPYRLAWPKLEKGDNKDILDAIRSLFPSSGIKRENIISTSQSDSQVVSWQIIKSSLAIGVNTVTKALEKDDLELVLVCHSTKPAILTNHLILLSATRSTPCCGIFGLSEVVAPLLGMKTVIALGFKKNFTMPKFKDLVEFIECKVPPFPEHYLALWKNQGHSARKYSSNQEESRDCVDKTNSNKDRRTKKRKINATYVSSKINSVSPRDMPKTIRKKCVKRQ